MSQKPLDQAMISRILGSTMEPVEGNVISQVLRHKAKLAKEAKKPPKKSATRRRKGTK